MQSFSNLFQLNEPHQVGHHHHHQMTPQHHNRHLGYYGYYHHHNYSHYHPTPSPSISVESCPESPSDESSESFSSSSKVNKVDPASSPKVEYGSSPKENFFRRHTGNHHHHSIQELIGHFRKKVHHWRSENGYRRNSCSESGNSAADEFRERSKSLDCNTKRPSPTDCESTYRIYNEILKEGAQLKQRSLDPERRRQSLGAIIPTNIHRASDAFLDPHHAAILFRDSRGVITAKGAAVQNCWGFIDGTARAICRPSEEQEDYYSGHKHFHCVKYQSVVTPDGITVSEIGAFPGRRHDAGIFRESGLVNQLEQKTRFPDGTTFVLFGDQAYGIRELLLCPFPGHGVNEAQRNFNTSMSVVRQAVEWSFQKIIMLFAFLDFRKNQKLLLQDIEESYKTATILSNCHTCLYGNQTSQFFHIDPINLEQYLNFNN